MLLPLGCHRSRSQGEKDAFASQIFDTPIVSCDVILFKFFHLESAEKFDLLLIRQSQYMFCGNIKTNKTKLSRTQQVSK